MTNPLIGSATLAPPPVGFSPVGQLTVPRVTTPPPCGDGHDSRRVIEPRDRCARRVVAVVA